MAEGNDTRDERAFVRRALIVCGLAVAGALLVRHAGLVADALGAVWDACLPLVIGLVIAYLLDVVAGLWSKLISRVSGGRMPRGALRAVCLVLAVLSACALVVIVVLVVRSDLPVLADGLRSLAAAALELASGVLGPVRLSELPINEIFDTLSQIVKQLGGIGELSSHVLRWGGSAASLLTSVVIGIVFAFFVLANTVRITDGARSLGRIVLRGHYERLEHACSVFNETFRNYIAGQCLEAFILGTLCALGMTILGFPYAGTVGICVGVTAFMPYLGAFLGGAVGVLLIASQSVEQAVAFVVYLVILQQFENHVIYPNVVGGVVGLPGIWAFAAVVVGGSLGGLLGIMIAVPTVSAARRLAIEWMGRSGTSAAEGARGDGEGGQSR